jgi:Na+/H+ antiporter 1
MGVTRSTGSSVADRRRGRRGPSDVAATAPAQSRRGALAEFLHDEAASGIVLLAAAVVAVAWANSLWRGAYFSLWHIELRVAGIGKDLQHWVNDGLMALFFFVVGLEIKRELVGGELSDRRAATLPALAATAGRARAGRAVRADRRRRASTGCNRSRASSRCRCSRWPTRASTSTAAC